MPVDQPAHGEAGERHDDLASDEGDDELRARPAQLLGHRLQEDTRDVADESGAHYEIGDETGGDDVPAEEDARPRAAPARGPTGDAWDVPEGHLLAPRRSGRGR